MSNDAMRFIHTASTLSSPSSSYMLRNSFSSSLARTLREYGSKNINCSTMNNAVNKKKPTAVVQYTFFARLQVRFCFVIGICIHFLPR